MYDKVLTSRTDNPFLAIERERETVLDHGGGRPGIEAMMRMYPKHRLGIVVTGNIDDYARLPSLVHGTCDCRGHDG